MLTNTDTHIHSIPLDETDRVTYHSKTFVNSGNLSFCSLAISTKIYVNRLLKCKPSFEMIQQTKLVERKNEALWYLSFWCSYLRRLGPALICVVICHRSNRVYNILLIISSAGIQIHIHVDHSYHSK